MRQEQVVLQLQVKRLTTQNVNCRRELLPDTDISILKQRLLKNRLSIYLSFAKKEEFNAILLQGTWRYIKTIKEI